MGGGYRADLRDGHAGLGQHLEQEGLEVVIGSIQLIDQQHRGLRPGVLDRLQQRPGDQELLVEQLILGELGTRRLRRADPEQLARIVPLVQRLGGVDAFVALQADQLVSSAAASALAASVLPTPASPSSSSGCGRRSERKSAVASPESAR